MHVCIRGVCAKAYLAVDLHKQFVLFGGIDNFCITLSYGVFN